MNNLLSAQGFIPQVGHYSIEDGLSNRDVQCIHEDRQGFMWIGTKYGLNRFDGYEFKWFTRERNGLQSNEINYFLEDGEGLLWLIFTTSLSFQAPVTIDLFNPVTGEVISFEEKFGNSLPFDYRNISSFTASENGQIAFVTKKNKFILYTSENGFEVFDLDVFPFTLSCFSKHSTIWGNLTKRDSFNRDVAGEIDLEIDSMLKQVIVEIGLDGKESNRFEHDHLFQYNVIAGVDPSDNFWYMLRHAETNRYRLAGYDQGNMYNIDLEGKEKRFSFDQIWTATGFPDLDRTILQKCQKLWVNPTQPFIWFDGNEFTFVFHTESGWNKELSSEFKGLWYPNTVYFNKEGRTWFGTEFGLSAVDLNPNPFGKIAHQGEDNAISAFRGITEDTQNKLWACSDRGSPFLLNIRPKNGQFEFKFLNEEDAWAFSFRYGIFTDRNGFLWVGSGEFGQITKYDVEADTLIHIPYSFEVGNTDRWVNIWSFHQDQKDRIWFGTDVGKIGYINEDQEVVTLPALEGVQNQGGCIYQFLEDKNGRTWIATDKGLFILDTESKKVSPFSVKEISDSLPFVEAGIFHIYEDSSGSFWMGTRGLGLIHWQPMTGNFGQFTKADGLSDNTIYAVYEDDFENLWMSSDYGIIQFNKTTHRTNAYLEKDGITHNEFNRISHYKSKDGTLFFGGLNGITAFHPKDLVGDMARNDIPLVLTKFQQFDGDKNQLIDKTSELQENTTITLAPNDRFFRLEFALLTYLNLENVQYAYKVEGVDQDWNYQQENSLRFSRLPYGKHVLRIKGQASDGQWSKRELALEVRVLKPFYIQTWFLLVAFFSLLAGLFLFFKWRTARLVKQKEELERHVANRTETIRQQAEELKSLERLKSRFFANVSHELRTPLTLMLGPTKTLLKEARENSRNKKLLQFINRNGNQLLKLINEILDLSKLESGKLELQEESVHLYAFLENLLAQFYSFGISEDIELSFDYQGEEKLQVLLDKSKVEKIVQNFLSNALKFTPPKGKVNVLVVETDHHVSISVKDTGKGIHPQDLPFIFDRFYQSKHDKGMVQGGTGIGLSLCRELAELMGGNVSAESELGIGSIFHFNFPKKPVEHALLSENEPTTSQTGLGVRSEEPGLHEMPVVATEKTILLPTNRSGAKRTTILLVEDNPDLQDYIKILLPEYNIITANNGKAALDLLMAEHGDTKEDGQIASSVPLPSTLHPLPDLIISDLMMPIMDGFEFLEKVKSDDRWRHIPMIMLTAKVNIKAKLNALRIGVDDYLTKPFEEEELKARINTLLRNYRERMELFSKGSDADNGQEKEGLLKGRPVIAHADAEWLENVERVFSSHLSDSRFKIDLAAHHLNLSLRQFQRRIKQITGLAANQYLQEMRLKEAKDHLYNGKYLTVKEAGFAVGYRNTKYFSTLFQKRFGKPPSSYIR